jgi:hypothetical protein
VPGELGALENAPRCRAPAVFLVTQRDRLVTPAFQRKVIDAYAGPKRVIDLREADHNAGLSAEEEAEVEAAVRWFGQQRGPEHSAQSQAFR